MSETTVPKFIHFGKEFVSVLTGINLGKTPTALLEKTELKFSSKEKQER